MSLSAFQKKVPRGHVWHTGKRINMKEIPTLPHDLDPSTEVLFLQGCFQMLS